MYKARPASVVRLQRTRIDLQNQACVFHVIVNIPGTVRYRKLGTTAEIHGSQHFSIRCLDRRGAVAVATKCEYSRCGGIINDRVELLARRNFGDRLQSLQIEDRNRRRLAVTYEPASQFWSDVNLSLMEIFGAITY